MQLNLACLRDVQACVAEVCRREPVVDLLVCNAGVVGGEYGLTEDGIERGFQVNYLGMDLASCVLTGCVLTVGRTFFTG